MVYPSSRRFAALSGLILYAVLGAISPPVMAMESLVAQAVPSASKLSQVNDENEATQAEADRLFDESLEFWRVSQWQEALDLLEQALVLYQEVGDRQGEAKTVTGLGAIADSFGQYSQALDYYQQALGIRREVSDRVGEGVTLNNIGSTYDKLGDYPQALDYYQQALGISREIGDRAGEGAALSNIGSTYDTLDDYPQALDYYQQALGIRHEIGDRAGKGNTLNNIGAIYYALDDYLQALDHYQQALGISRKIGDRAGEGITLSNIGLTYSSLGDYPQSLDYTQQALAIQREVGNRSGEGITLNTIGLTYHSLGDYPQALDYYQQALAIRREVGDQPGEGTTLTNIGVIYDKLGDYPQALDYTQQALAIRREVGDRAGEGSTLNSIGSTYSRLGDYPQALDYYQQALRIRHEVGDRAGEGSTLTNIGVIYDKLGDYSQALDYYQQALGIGREIGDRFEEGITLNNIGVTYRKLGDYPQALDYYQQALQIRREIGDRAGEGITLNNIGRLLDQTNEPELAIIFLKQSVNVYETIRQTNQQLEQELQQSYTETVAGTYRKLADVLLKENRILEAQAVLDLLRTQELDDYFQDVRSTTATADLPYWQPEERILDLYQEFLQNATELADLRAKPFNDLTPDEQERLRQLGGQEGELRTEFTAFVDNPAVRDDIATLRKAETGDIELDALLELQNNIKDLPNAVILYPLIFEDRLELMLIPSNAPPIRRRVEVNAEDINRVIGQYRQMLRTPRSKSKAEATAHQLYDWLIQPLEDDLAALDTQTIVYSPDGALRYIPLAALHDGNQWLTERFAITHITNKSTSDLSHQPTDNPRVLAGACADCSFTPTVNNLSYPFRDLPFTRTEVANLAAQIPTTDVLIDQDFSRTETELRLGSYNIIHLATHGAFVSDSPDESFLLFGDGAVATLREVKSWPLSQADLVVLSACETGVGGQNLDDVGNGIEVLGIGFQLERAGAKAAIASLWKVSDGGTQTLMDAFYTALNNGHGKAEALRRAQLALIRNDASVLALGERGSSLESTTPAEPLTIFAESSLQGDLDHPYYWAPFILIGNGL